MSVLQNSKTPKLRNFETPKFAKQPTPLIVILELTRGPKLLHGVPVCRTAAGELACGNRDTLGRGSVSVLVEDPAQLVLLRSFKSVYSIGILVLNQLNVGLNRAGVQAGSDQLRNLIDLLLLANGRHEIVMSGFYSHSGHSYGSNTAAAATDTFKMEVTAALAAANDMIASARVP